MTSQCVVRGAFLFMALISGASLSGCELIRSASAYIFNVHAPSTGAAGAGELTGEQPIDVSGDSAEAPDGSTWPLISAVELEDGLIIQELRLGEGAYCEPASWIRVHYHGSLADGRIVDSTRGGKPAGPWPLTRMIDGWQRGLVGMRAGGIRRLVIPPALGYGEAPLTRPGSEEVLVPPGSTLIYSIELVDVQ